MRKYRSGWLEWEQRKPGHYLSENGEWQIRKEGSRWHTYIKDQYDKDGRHFRFDSVPPYRTLRDAQDHVDEYDVRGFDAYWRIPGTRNT